MSEVLDAELSNRNTQLTLIGAFAAIALGTALVGIGLGFVAGLAALVPALRAASVNPMTAIRAEG